MEQGDKNLCVARTLLFLDFLFSNRLNVVSNVERILRAIIGVGDAP